MSTAVSESPYLLIIVQDLLDCVARRRERLETMMKEMMEILSKERQCTEEDTPFVRTEMGEHILYKWCESPETSIQGCLLPWPATDGHHVYKRGVVKVIALQI